MCVDHRCAWERQKAVEVGRNTHTMDPCPPQSRTGRGAHSLSNVHRRLDNPLSDQQPPVNNVPMSRRGERTVLNERVAVGWLTSPVAATLGCNRNAFLAPWRNTRLASSVSPSSQTHMLPHAHPTHLTPPRPTAPPGAAPCHRPAPRPTGSPRHSLCTHMAHPAHGPSNVQNPLLETRHSLQVRARGLCLAGSSVVHLELPVEELA